MTSANTDTLLDQLLDAARAEVAAQQARASAEEAYRRAWWITSLLLASIDLPHGQFGRVADKVAEQLGCVASTVRARRRVALRVDPAVVADESIYSVGPSAAGYFLSATGVETIGPRETVVLQEVEAEGWTRPDVERRGDELRTRLGLSPATSQRATPRSQPTVWFNNAQLTTFSERVRVQADTVGLTRLANSALDVVASYESSVDRFRLTAEGTVIEGPA